MSNNQNPQPTYLIFGEIPGTWYTSIFYFFLCIKYYLFIGYPAFARVNLKTTSVQIQIFELCKNDVTHKKYIFIDFKRFKVFEIRDNVFHRGDVIWTRLKCSNLESRFIRKFTSKYHWNNTLSLLNKNWKIFT